MPYITKHTYNQLISRSEIQGNLKIDYHLFTAYIYNSSKVYYCLSYFDKEKLFKEKVILTSDKNYVIQYKEIPTRKDNYQYVFSKESKAKFHKNDKCKALNKGFKDFKIPEPIANLQGNNDKKHQELVEELRNWFSINNYTIPKYLNKEINDKTLTREFNKSFALKHLISPISISQNDANNFKWFEEKKNIGIEDINFKFNIKEYKSKVDKILQDRDFLCSESKTMYNISKYDFLYKKSDDEIQEYIVNKINTDKLKLVSLNFIKNYTLIKLKDFFKKHFELRTKLFELISEYLKWTYNYNIFDMDEITLRNFNIEPCSLCHKKY